MDIVKSKLKILKMSGALTEIDELYRDALKNQKDYLELINSLLEVEINDKYARRINNRIKKAKFPVSKSLSDFDFSIRPSLNKHEIVSFTDGSIIQKKENIILIGNPGLGKTHLATAIAYELCKKDYNVWFTTGTRLINTLTEAKDEQELGKYFKMASTLDLVVIDEVGYFPYEKNDSELFFQFISERYERGSIIITTNLPFSKWNEIFYTERMTTAILDRLIHHCHIIELEGDSYRFNQSLNKKKEVKKKKT